MSNLLVLLCHPEEGSFNHAIADEVARTLRRLGHGVDLHDLYREGFDPVLTGPEVKRRFSFDESVQGFTEALTAADGLIVIHPDWWGQPPALLKGWLDRVLRPGVAYEFEGAEFTKKEQTPLLTGKKGLALCTTDTEKAGSPHPLEAIWEERVFRFCGMEEAGCHIFHELFKSSPRERREWLSLIRHILEASFPAVG